MTNADVIQFIDKSVHSGGTVYCNCDMAQWQLHSSLGREFITPEQATLAMVHMSHIARSVPHAQLSADAVGPE